MAVTETQLPASTASVGIPEPKTAAELGPLVAELVAQHRRERPRLDTLAKWYAGTADDIYVPTKVTTEYRRLVEQSKMNVLPLVEKTVRQALAVDGFRATSPSSGRAASPTNSRAWQIWQANRMDARQARIWGPAIRFGWSYAVVEPGTPDPLISPFSPRVCVTVWNDRVNDEWPRAALVLHTPVDEPAAPGSDPIAEQSKPRAGARGRLYDEWYRYELEHDHDGWKLLPGRVVRHGLGVVPVVRFPDEEPSYDREEAIAPGKIEPLIPAQRQLNQITYALAMALQYGAFRQRWVTGMAVAQDANGADIQPFNPGVDKLYHATEEGTKFGEFGQTDVTGFLDARDRVLGYMGSVSQIPPHNLVVGTTIANLNAEALASLQYSHRRDIDEHERTFGEGVEQMLRLCGLAAGDRSLWEDLSARVHWADTTPRTLAEEADAYGKLHVMLGVPQRALWRRLTDVSDQELEEWAREADAQEQGRLLELEALTAELETEARAADGQADNDDAPGNDGAS